MATTTTTIPTAASHPFTCNTCQVAFRGSELQRGHMQSDWQYVYPHERPRRLLTESSRYNLKRRVASLPPLTSEIFTEKVLANQASTAATAARASFERICAPCQRTYFSENAYQNHIGSVKHRVKVAQLQAGSITATEDGAESMTGSTFSLGDASISRDTASTTAASEVDVSSTPDSTENSSRVDTTHSVSQLSDAASSDSTATRCLFCNVHSSTLEANLTHMEKVHSLFIPERVYLVDLAGLINHLTERVFELHECLYCGQLRHSTVGVQTHMRDKGHCMIAFESEEEMIEVGQFYDFRSTYSDEEDEAAEADADWEDADEEEADAAGDAGGGEEGESDRGSETTEKTEVTTTTAPLSRADRAYRDDYELHLPTGRTAGHRSLARYFRQNLHNYPSAAERMAQLAIADSAAESDGIDMELQQPGGNRGRHVVSRANGGQGMLGVSELKKKEVAKAEVRERKREQRQQAKYQWGNNRRSNFQEHFRDPLLQ